MSPIHDQSYRHYKGTRQPPGRAWAVIAMTGIRELLSRRMFLGFLLFAWIPFIARVIQIYGVTMMPAVGQLAPINPKMFQDFVEQQGVVVFFVTIWAGAGLIANDRKANALQIYLSKPLSRTEYIGGKLAVLLVYLAEVTLLPALLLIIVQIALSGSLDFIRANLYIVPAVTLASLMRVVVSAVTVLALSSLSKSSRYVAILYTGAVFFTEAVYGFFFVITGGSTRVAWVSISRNLERVTDLIFRQTPRYDTPALVSILVLLGLVVVSISVLERRVRGVEVVK